MTTNTDYITCLYRGSQKNFVVPYFDFDKCEKFGIAQIYQKLFPFDEFPLFYFIFFKFGILNFEIVCVADKKT